jgi:hypothetical protein
MFLSAGLPEHSSPAVTAAYGKNDAIRAMDMAITLDLQVDLKPSP